MSAASSACTRSPRPRTPVPHADAWDDEHGAQRICNAAGEPTAGRPEPLTYYHFTSPIAQGIKAARERRTGPLRLAVVGLASAARRA
jgi:hypothetical protein